MIFVKGTTLWHAVRSFGDEITTLCGRHLPGGTPTANNVPDEVFLCRTCQSAMHQAG